MIARKTYLTLLSNIFAGILGYIALFFVVRLMGVTGVEALGKIGFALAFIGLFSLLGDFGFSQAHVKRISEGKDLGKCIGTYVVIKTLLVVLMTATVLIAVLVWKYILHKGFYDATEEKVLYMILLWSALYGLSQIATHTFTAKMETAKLESTTFSNSIVKTAATIIVAVLGLSAVYLASTYVLGVAATLIVMLMLFRRYPIAKPEKEYFKSYLSFAVPIAFTGLIGVVAYYIDKIMIGWFWTATEVGYYFSMQNITMLMLIIPSAVGALLFPTISEYHSKKRIKDIQKVTHAAERYISLILFPVVAFIVVLSPSLILIILSGALLPAKNVLRLLALFGLISALNVPYLYQITGVNRPKLAAGISVLVGVINMTLNILFIPRPEQLFGAGLGLGASGAALATLVSTSVGLVVARCIVKKLTNTKSNPKILYHVWSACIMGLTLYLLNIFIPMERLHHLVFFILIGSGVYFGLLRLINEFTGEDLKFFADTLNLRKLWRYIKSELKK